MIKDNIYKFLDEVKVYDCGFHKIRIGNKSDGGYVAIDEICHQTKTLYSCGIDDNVTFEIDFVKKYSHSKVKLFDHTIDHLPQNHPNFTFIKKGIGPQTTQQFDSLPLLLDDEVGNITLKMDIEWDEWKTLLSLSPSHFDKIDQLLVEFHVVDVPFPEVTCQLTPYFENFYKCVYQKINNDVFEMYYKTIKLLNEHFVAFHIHANNSLKKNKVGEYEFPPLLEISFVKKSLVDEVKRVTQNFPIVNLDYPNKSFKAELKDFYPLIKRKENVK